MKIEIDDMGTSAIRHLWYELGVTCQLASNRIWRLWLLHHHQAGSEDKLRDFLEAHAIWKSAPVGSKKPQPKCSVECVPNSLVKVIYRNLTQRFPGMHGRCLTLLLNTIRAKIIKRKASRGSLPGWSAILLDHERYPGSINPLPVPFDKKNSRVFRDAKKRVCLAVRGVRTVVAGKRGTSDEHIFVLRTTGRSARYTLRAQRMADGEMEISGSSIFYDSGKRKWFALIAYQEESKTKADLNPLKTCFVKFGAHCPWIFRADGQSRWLAGSGEWIAERREYVSHNRLARQNNYRWAATSTKGHGRKRALAAMAKLQQSWKMFTKHINESVAHEALQRAIARRCGRIVVLGSAREDSFVRTAGKNPELRESSSWPTYQFTKILQDRAANHGIKVIIRGDKSTLKALA